MSLKAPFVQKPTALVTGGAKRIGRAIALALAEKGYNIALHYNHSKDDVIATRSAVEAKGVSCHIFHADLKDSGSYKKLVDTVFQLYPNCTLLVNNASIFERGSFLETTEELFDAHMDTNFKAPFFLTQAFSRCCRNGLVVNIVDSYVKRDTGAYFAYLLSKKALYNFNRMAARALAPGIRVNAIAIGTTDISNNITAQEIDKKKASTPLRGTVAIEEVTYTLLDIVHNPSITGECIFVDRGEHLL